MPTRRTSRSTSCSTPMSSLECLEPKQLLSGVNGPDVRTIEVIDHVAHANQFLSIEEVYRASDEVWVLTASRDVPDASTFNQTDTPPVDIAQIDVAAPVNLPVRVFRIAAPVESSATPVDGYADFHQQLDEVESSLLYARVDPALSEWRESTLEQLLSAGREKYGDQFGEEAEAPGFGYDSLVPIEDITGDNVIRLFDSVTALGDAVSDTNNQVDGVDEVDVVETDGSYIYSVSGSELVITSAADQNGTAHVVSRTQLTSRVHHGIFLHEGRLTILSSGFGPFYSAPTVGGSVHLKSRSRTVVSVMDVSDATAPLLVQETVLDGAVESARAIDNDVYVVLNNTTGVPRLRGPWVRPDETSSTGYRSESYETWARNQQLQVDQLTPPSVYQRTSGATNQLDVRRTGWLRSSLDELESGFAQQTSIVRFDMLSAESTPTDTLSFRTSRYGASHLYATRDALYVATTRYPEDEIGGIMFRRRGENATTLIRKIAIDGERMEQAGQGQVPGVLESSFSLDEHNGYLRVATTLNEWSITESENQISVLEDVGDELAVVGQLGGLAVGERIYSARFDGDRGWIVTFRQIDPVFSFDLSDPTNPRLTGELKIPGFSEHLQLIDDNHLLAIGRDATPEGFARGIQVSLFDVSDLSDPQLLHQRTLNDDDNQWGYSEALHNHHAFHYIADRGLLVVPYQNETSSNGLMTLRIDPQQGIDVLGYVTAADSHRIRRSVQIGNHLYGIGDASIIVIALDAPDTVLEELPFAGEQTSDRESLLNRFFQSLGDRINLRDHLGAGGERFTQIELPRLLEQSLADTDLLDFEFLVNDAETGQEVLRRLSEDPLLKLEDAAQQQLPEGTYEFLVRSRNRLLDNPQWGDWILGDVFRVGSDEPAMISDLQLSELAPLLEWTDIPDLVTSTIEDGVTTSHVNPVDHFEVWISDVAAGHMVIYDRDVSETELPLDSLRPGEYHAWFRGIYADGEAADWSPRTTFEILGKPLQIVEEIFTTADRLPSFSWEDIADAVSYEIEIVRPDGSTTVYTADNLADAQHDLTEGLAAGDYSLRVRAALPAGYTEWAEHQFTILDRPDLHIRNGRMELRGVDGALMPGGQESVELWIGNSDTGERVFHSTEWNESTIRDFVTRVGLRNQVGQYEAWVRLVGEENSKWSHGQSFEVFHEAITVLTTGHLAGGEQQILEWLPEETVESYEIFVQRAGQAGAYYQADGLTGSRHELPQLLPTGNYKYWMRGLLPDDRGFTKWTAATTFSVTPAAAPALSFDGSQISWQAPTAAAHHHLWINRVDEDGNLLEARIAHFREFTGNNFSTELLPDGHYSAWVQSLVDTRDGQQQTAWSDRFSFEVRTLGDVIDNISDVIDDIDDQIGDVIDALNGF